MFHILYLLSALLPAPARVTCTCLPIYDSLGNEMKINYDLIVKAKVEKIDTIFYIDERWPDTNYSRDSGMYFTGIMVSLNVNTVFKGNKTGKKIRVMTGIGGGDCGYYFQTGKNYIVYANRKQHILIDSFSGENKNTFKTHDEIVFETDVCDGTTDQVIKEEVNLKKRLKSN